MYSFKAAQVLFVSCHAGDQFANVKLDNFVAFTRPCVGDVKRDGCDEARAGAPPDLIDGHHLRTDREIAVREGRVTQTVPEEIEGAVDARLFSFPLGIWFGRKVVGNLTHGPGKGDTQLP